MNSMRGEPQTFGGPKTPGSTKHLVTATAQDNLHRIGPSVVFQRVSHVDLNVMNYFTTAVLTVFHHHHEDVIRVSQVHVPPRLSLMLGEDAGALGPVPVAIPIHGFLC